MTPEERAQSIVERYDAISEERVSLQNTLVLWISQAIRDAENEAEERCYAASEELCAKIAEMHDELQHLRPLKSQEI